VLDISMIYQRSLAYPCCHCFLDTRRCSRSA
jgi:hypothetical protein